MISSRDEIINVLIHDYAMDYEELKKKQTSELINLLNYGTEGIFKYRDPNSFRMELNMLVNDYSLTNGEFEKIDKTDKERINDYYRSFGMKDNDEYVE